MPHSEAMTVANENPTLSMSESLILDVRNLSKTFTLHERNTIINAFSNISFTVKPGKMTCLVGASGSGKSSIVRCIYRSYLTSSGQIYYQSADDQCIDLAIANEETILELRRKEIRIVSQFLKVLPRQTSLEVVAWPLRELNVDKNEALEQAAQIMRTIGIPERLWEIPPATFSGGEKQLINLARALVVTPRLLLLDEPTASLDPSSTDMIVDAIEKMKANKIAMLGIFHNKSIVNRLADEQHEISGGIQLQQ